MGFGNTIAGGAQVFLGGGRDDTYMMANLEGVCLLSPVPCLRASPSDTVGNGVPVSRGYGWSELGSEFTRAILGVGTFPWGQ